MNKYLELTGYLNSAKSVLNVDQDLKLVKQGIKTRKPVPYGHKVVVRRQK